MLSHSKMKYLQIIVLICVLIEGIVSPAFGISLFQVSLDVSALSGTEAQLAFDLTSADPAANLATITNFSTDGILGVASATGGPVTGALPSTTTLADVAFFNELLQDITLGNTVTFTLDLTGNHTGGSITDQFAFFLLDATSGLPLFPTTDPTGADALFTVDITGTASGDLQVFALTTTQVAPVPEPASWLLIITGLGGLVTFRRWRSPRL